MIIVYPGSFDPVTPGHADIALRGAALASRLIVVILRNPAKNPMFSVRERMEFLADAIVHPHVEIAAFDGLLADFALQVGANALLRGIRGSNDLESEIGIARTNHALCGIETIFLPAAPQYAHISAGLIREAMGFTSPRNLNKIFLQSILTPMVFAAAVSKMTAALK